jgi:hypothetical protein
VGSAVNRQDFEELERVDTTSASTSDFQNARPTNPEFGARTDHDVSPSNLFAETSEAPRAGSRRLRAALVAGDVLGITAAWVITTLSATVDKKFALFSMQRLGFIPVMLAITMTMLVTGKLYRARMCSVRAVETAGIVRAGAMSAVLGWLVAERVRATDLSLGRMVWTQALAVLFIFVGRMTYRALFCRA